LVKEARSLRECPEEMGRRAEARPRLDAATANMARGIPDRTTGGMSGVETKCPVPASDRSADR